MWLAAIRKEANASKPAFLSNLSTKIPIKGELIAEMISGIDM